MSFRRRRATKDCGRGDFSAGAGLDFEDDFDGVGGGAFAEDCEEDLVFELAQDSLGHWVVGSLFGADLGYATGRGGGLSCITVLYMGGQGELVRGRGRD